MDSASIQSKINFGYGRAASFLGVACNHYRPTAYNAVITPATLIDTQNVFFDPDFKFGAMKPSSYGHPVWAAAFDRTSSQAGDYLVDPSGNTYFISAYEALLPTAAILCNHTLNVYRPSANNPGTKYYGGNVTGYGKSLLIGWPGSVTQGPKGEKDDSFVIGAERDPWFVVLIPSAIGVEINKDDLLVTEQNVRFIVSSIEQTTLGLRMTCAYANS